MRSRVTILVLLLMSVAARAQKTDTIYYNSSWKIIKNKSDMAFYRVAQRAGIVYSVWDYYANGTLQMTGSVLDPYSENFVTNKHGYFVYYDSLGNKENEGNYKDSKRDGEWKGYYAGNKLAYQETYVGNILNGPATIYDSVTGNLLRRGGFTNGKMSGLWILYNDGAEKKLSEVNFSKGLLEGSAVYYDSATGNKRLEGMHKNGSRDGQWIEYYAETGRIWSRVIYKDGKLDGNVYTYDSLTGEVVTAGQYNKGIEYGMWYRYFPGTSKVHYTSDISKDLHTVLIAFYDSTTQNVVKRAETYDDKRVGTWKYYTPTGKLSATETYKKGMLNGAVVHYDTLGNVYLQSNYRDDKKDGKWVLNHPYTNDVWIRYSFDNDVVDGKLECFYPSGKVKRKETFVKGIIASSKCYAEDGSEMPYYPILTEAKFEQDPMTYIGDNLRYPEALKADAIEGKVLVRFSINESGMVDDVEVTEGIHPLCDAEATRLISQMPPWQPATVDAQPYKVFQTLPIVFWIH